MGLWKLYAALFVAVALGSSVEAQDDASCALDPVYRFDCHPEKFATEETCVARGCCWMDSEMTTTEPPDMTDTMEDPMTSAGQNNPGKPPQCFYPSDFPAYTVTGVTGTSVGFEAELMKHETAFYPREVTTLKVHVMYESDTRVRVKIYDPATARYEVPLEAPEISTMAANPQYTVTVSAAGERFTLTVSRNGNDAANPLFRTDAAAPLIFTDQYLQLSSVLPSNNMYGLGETRKSLRLNMEWMQHTLYSADHWVEENVNLYGVHPFYINMEDDGSCNGFFFMNSNAMDVVLQPTPAITWRTIGGILDFYIFTGPSPAQVMKDFTDVIGRPMFPPYWSLGFHICRFGYKSVNDTWIVVDRVRDHMIPQDTQWSDSDYKIQTRDFTNDVEVFGNISEFANDLHDRGMRYIIIVDPGLSSTQPSGTYRPYDLGMEMDIFIKNASGDPISGVVWPGPTVYPDYSSPVTQVFWTTIIREFMDYVAVDGLWIDMNEVSSFVNGSLEGCPGTELDDPPYVPNIVGGKLYHLTICPSAQQNLSTAYNLHSLFGYMMSKQTYTALQTIQPNKRPFVISRSTYTGQGHYGGHWTGDQFATFHDLYRSISAIVTAGLTGISMIGADICGFYYATTYELCLRWYQMGAFYPFSRSHNVNSNEVNQDPGAFDDYFAGVVRAVYEVRYSLLPLLYTLFYQSQLIGEPVARAMFYEFPSDKGSLSVDTQFLWGSELLIAPVLSENTSTVDAYLPPGTVWYNFTTGMSYDGQGSEVTLDAPLGVINLLVQGGRIIPMQEPALTTYYSRQNEFSLLVAIGTNNSADGQLFWDDGESPTYETGTFNIIQFNYLEGRLYSDVAVSGYATNMTLGAISVYGLPNAPQKVTIDDVEQVFSYDDSTMALRVPNLSPKVDLLTAFVMAIQ